MDTCQNALYHKIGQGERVTPEEARALFDWELIFLARAADMRRKIIFPHETVGFIRDRIINFTNICEAKCHFCAYHAEADRLSPYCLTVNEILAKIETLVKNSGKQVMLQGGLHPDYTINDYLTLIEAVKNRFPSVYLHSFSPAELMHISRKSNLSLAETIKRLKAAGLDSVPGASDLLVPRIRQLACPHKITVAEWRRVMQTLADHDMRSSATMTYGMGESLSEKIAHLMVIREIQDQTGILRAFIPWSFSPAHTRMEEIPPSTGLDYLKIVAIARIFLDNIVHIQAGWLTEGLKIAQIALSLGATDMGGVLTEETVVKATGITTRTHADELIQIIQNTGKIPVERDSEYHIIHYFKGGLE